MEASAIYTGIPRTRRFAALLTVAADCVCVRKHLEQLFELVGVTIEHRHIESGPTTISQLWQLQAMVDRIQGLVSLGSAKAANKTLSLTSAIIAIDAASPTFDTINSAVAAAAIAISAAVTSVAVSTGNATSSHAK